jgi:arsenite methyltransferase
MMFERVRAEDFKRQVRNSFDATGAEYGTKGDFHWQFAKRLVDHTPLQPGQALLDVATGTAPAAIMAAQRVGRAGRVVGVDISAGILTLAKQNIRAASISNIDLVAGDAEYLPLAEYSVDGIVCSSAIVWFPDIPRALSEWYRVLRPQGYISFSCFGGPARQTINELVQALLIPYGIRYPELNVPLNAPDKCRILLRQAGYTNVSIEIAEEKQFTTDPEASFTQALASGSRFDIQLTPDQLAHIKAQYIEQFRRLVENHESWNRDYEQYVIAYKP